MLSVRVRWCLFVREIKHPGVFGLNYCVCSCWFVSVDKKDFVDKLLLKNWWGIFISKSPHWGNFGGILPPNPPLFIVCTSHGTLRDNLSPMPIIQSFMLPSVSKTSIN